MEGEVYDLYLYGGPHRVARRHVHETHDIVLLTSLGVSPSGEIFNVNSEFLAATVAGAMGASKIIYFNVHGTSFQNKVAENPFRTCA